MKKWLLLFLIIFIIGISFIGVRYFFTDLTLGKKYLNYSYYYEAIKRFKSVLNKDPNNIEGHIYLGLAYGKKRDYEKALKEFQWVKDKGVKVELPARTYNELGMIYYLLEMYPQAIEEFKKATELNPRFAEAYFNLGTAFSANGDSQQAIAAYKKVLEVEPRNSYAHWNLAINLENMDNIEGAIYHWEKYIEFVPGVFRHPDVERHLRELKSLKEGPHKSRNTNIPITEKGLE